MNTWWTWNRSFRLVCLEARTEAVARVVRRSKSARNGPKIEEIVDRTGLWHLESNLARNDPACLLVQKFERPLDGQHALKATRYLLLLYRRLLPEQSSGRNLFELEAERTQCRSRNQQPIVLPLGNGSA